MNLAFWRYKKIVGSDRPIQEVLVQSVDSIFGEKYFEAYAYLNTNLISKTHEHSKIYGSSTGTGSSKLKMTSVFKSISEAIERWAYFDATTKGDLQYGLNEELSTSGFSAFPGFTPLQAKQNSNNEALERWALLNWWLGNIGMTQENSLRTAQGKEIKVYSLKAESRSKPVIVSAKALDPFGKEFYIYGFAADKSLTKATARALVEMERNFRVLLLKIGTDIDQIRSLQDARLLYFSTADGNSRFEQKVEMALKNNATGGTPRLVFSGEVMGPWSKYAFVWRTLYEMPSVGSSMEVFYF